jgi:hypothetical protein
MSFTSPEIASVSHPPAKRPKSEALKHAAETKETEGMTTAQLGRLVLLKQLQYLNKKLDGKQPLEVGME